MTITLSAWVVPAIITVIAVFIAIRATPRSSGDYDFATPILAVLFFGIALIVSLVAWLIWALSA